MKRLLLAFLILPFLGISQSKNDSIAPYPNKKYSVTLFGFTLQEYQSMISALGNSDFISAGLSQRFGNEIALSLNTQLQSETKLQDSVKGHSQPISDSLRANKPKTSK